MDVQRITLNGTTHRVVDNYASSFVNYASPYVNKVSDIETKVNAKYTTEVEVIPFLMGKSRYITKKLVNSSDSQPIPAVANPFDDIWSLDSLTHNGDHTIKTWSTLDPMQDYSWITQNGENDDVVVINLAGELRGIDTDYIVESSAVIEVVDNNMCYSEASYTNAGIACFPHEVGKSKHLIAFRFHVNTTATHDYEIYVGLDPIGLISNKRVYELDEKGLKEIPNIIGYRRIVKAGETVEFNSVLENDLPEELPPYYEYPQEYTSYNDLKEVFWTNKENDPNIYSTSLRGVAVCIVCRGLSTDVVKTIKRETSIKFANVYPELIPST